MNNSTLKLVIIYGICAAIWLVKTIIDFIAMANTIILVLDVACDVVWIAAFILMFIQYKKDKKE